MAINTIISPDITNTTLWPEPTNAATNFRNQSTAQYASLTNQINTEITNKLNATTNGASGAHHVGSAAISGVTGATVYAQVADIKAQLDLKGAAANYYTKTELNAGQLDNRYYTESETDAAFVTKTDLTTNRKLSATGDFTGTLNGAPIIATEPGLSSIVSAHFAESAYNPKFYGAVCDGITDDTQALLDCITAMPEGAELQITGRLRFTSSVVINKLIHIFGLNNNAYSEAAYRAKSCLIKDGAFNGIVLNKEGSSIERIQIDGAEGNDGNGLVLGASRIKVKNVTTTNHGNSGIEIGSTGSNWNCWSLENIVSLNNGSHGINIDDTVNELANCNAGTAVNLDLRGNVGNGLNLGKTYDNTFIGVVAQSNGGKGVELKSGAKGNQMYGTYTEANTTGSIVLDSGADKNIIFGFMSGEDSDSITDNGAGNFILGRNSQITGTVPYFKSPTAFKTLIVEDSAISGYWKFIENPSTRSLEISSEGTGTTPLSVILKHNNSGKIRFLTDELLVGASNSYLKAILYGAATLDFGGSILANATKDVTMTVTGCVAGNTVIVTPGTLAAGLVCTAFVSGTNTVTVRMANVTTSPISGGSIACYVEVFQH